MSAAFPLEAARAVLAQGFDEDLGTGGDITTRAVFPAGCPVVAQLVAREALVVAGLPLLEPGFVELKRRGEDPAEVELVAQDGATVAPGAVLARIRGDARAVLTGERLLLNLIGRLSGIASVTAEAVAEVAGTGARVSDTRKTTPGLRVLEKYAVAVGGGENHRPRLDAQVLVKDNHKELAGGLGAVLAALESAGIDWPNAEIEVDTLDELREVVDSGIGWVLLDNMSPDQVREAAAIAAGRVHLEVSGGLRPGKLRSYAEAGVQRLSMGHLTHSVRSRDVSLDIEGVER